MKSSEFSERAKIVGKKFAKFVAEMIRDFHFEEDEELLLVEECITQEDINKNNSNILSPIYYTDN